MSHGYRQFWERLMQGALHAVTSKGIPDGEIDGPGIARSPTNQRLRAEGIAWKAHATVLVGWILELVAAAPSDPPFKV
jgi:hypothetical protein